MSIAHGAGISSPFLARLHPLLFACFVVIATLNSASAAGVDGISRDHRADREAAAIRDRPISRQSQPQPTSGTNEQMHWASVILVIALAGGSGYWFIHAVRREWQMGVRAAAEARAAARPLKDASVGPVKAHSVAGCSSVPNAVKTEATSPELGDYDANLTDKTTPVLLSFTKDREEAYGSLLGLIAHRVKVLYYELEGSGATCSEAAERLMEECERRNTALGDYFSTKRRFTAAAASIADSFLTYHWSMILYVEKAIENASGRKVEDRQFERLIDAWAVDYASRMRRSVLPLSVFASDMATLSSLGLAHLLWSRLKRQDSMCWNP